MAKDIKERVEEFKDEFCYADWTTEWFPHPLGIINWLTQQLTETKQEGIKEGLKMAMECLPEEDELTEDEFTYGDTGHKANAVIFGRNENIQIVKRTFQQKLSEITIKKEDK